MRGDGPATPRVDVGIAAVGTAGGIVQRLDGWGAGRSNGWRQGFVMWGRRMAPVLDPAD